MLLSGLWKSSSVFVSFSQGEVLEQLKGMRKLEMRIKFFFLSLAVSYAL